uniref:IS66 family transposase zinc-finger binding domain-containing protein n=1 Tax=Lysinibacillus mangiferihumi TaxID=1130819 RepID=UPI001F48E412|nr:IS66 family transposase zinc-finger binding domain-containing protein [Lysinibacillus mangiferihumi]
MGNVSTNDKVIELFEEQLTYMKKQNEELSIKLDQSLSQNKALAEQIRQLTKALYGSKSEKSKYQAPDGQGSLFEDDPSFKDPEHTEEQSTATITYTVVRKLHKKKRNDSFRDGIKIEEIHHHPENKQCDCCLGQMTEAGTTLAREEAKFILATMKRIQHIEHAYECRHCKKDTVQKAQMKRGKAPQAAIQRSIAGPTVLAKLIYDKINSQIHSACG